MAGLSDVKPGDEVLCCGRDNFRQVVKVTRLTSCRIVVGKDYYYRESGFKVGGIGQCLSRAAPAEIAAVKEAARKVQAEWEAQRRTREEKARDPHYQLVQRFKNGDFEPYEKLTLEQLRQIAKWLDETKVNSALDALAQAKGG